MRTFNPKTTGRLLAAILPLIAFLFTGYSSGAQQLVAATRPLAVPPSTVLKQFADLTSAAADPADSICARSAVGSAASDPPSLSSQTGVLEVTFHYQSTTDVQGLTRYCYVYTDSSGQAQESPTLRVNAGDQLIIHFFNDLTAASPSAAHAHTMKMQPAASGTASDCSATTVTASSTNLHFHGTNVAPVCHQDEVLRTLIQPQANFDYTVQIPANEPPGMYWYHPHPHGFSNGQVLGGASGAIIVEGIENINSAVANLPERVFILRDQTLPNSVTAVTGNPEPKTDLSINYVPILYPSYTPAQIDTAPSEAEFWRVANTAADTLLDLQVQVNGVPQPLQIVAVDGVPLTDSNGSPTTTTQTDYLIPSAGRVEFVVTTPPAGAPAQLVTLTHNNGASGDADPGRPIANIVSSASSASATIAKGAVVKRRLPDTTNPQAVKRFVALGSAPIAVTRSLYFSVKPDFSEFYVTVDGQNPAVFNMDGPPSIIATEGTVEQWTIENHSTMDHSFHIHQLHFQTVEINGVATNDTTLRDTIDIPAWSNSGAYPSVTLLMDFRDPNIVGTFVYHCHILSHEDLGMMAKIQVLPGVTNTTLTAAPSTAPFGASVALTATVAPSAGSGTPTGTVTFMNGSTTLGTATLDSTGVAALNTTTLPIGSNRITAAYGGDTSFAGSTSAAVSVAVTAATTSTTLTSSASAITPGGSVTFTASVADTSGAGTPAGTVIFLNGATTLGTAALNGTGVATFTTKTLPNGSASVTAAYAGNTSFAASTSSAVVVNVQTGTSATALTASPTTTSVGSSVAFTATVTAVSGGSGTPTGTVTFKNGATTLGTGTLNSAGVAAYSIATLPVGSASVTASYSGDGTFSASTSAPVVVTVNTVPTTVALSAAPTSTVLGGNVTFTATVAGTTGTGSPTGTVTFKNGGTVLGTGALGALGVATLATTSLPIGSASVSASYSGDGTYAAAASAAVTVTVTTVPTTTTLTANPMSVVSGGSVALTATVAGTAGTPSGTVTFSNGTTVLGTAPLNASGVAAYSTSSLAIGAASITAAYSGSSSFAGSTSAAVTVTVTAPPVADFTVAISPASFNVVAGASASGTLTITPQNGFNSAVSLTCSGMPGAAACAFGAATLTPDGTHAATTAVNLTTTASTTAQFLHPIMPGESRPLYALVLPGLGALLGIGRLRKHLPPAMRSFGIAFAALLLAAGLSACGGSSFHPSNNGTPAGTSTVTVTATSGTTVHTATFTLVVTQ